jgi:autotransporter translocation and assembly factor TamB
MRALRRLLQVFALVGTIMIGVMAVALIVSQTPWFRDWLRRYIVRESKQYLNGELSIGRLDGNLLFGVQLSDVAVDVSGERVIAARGLEVDYSVLELISKGIVLHEIKLVQPQVRLERDGNGWNLARIVKEQRKEAEREGPARPVSLESIEVTDAQVTVTDGVGTSGYRLPERIEGLDIKAAFEYEPVHYTLDVDRISFRGASPQFTLQSLSGRIAARNDNLYFEKVSVKTGESTVSVDGVVEQYLRTPNLKLTTTGNVSLPEIGAIVPAASGYGLHPAFDLKANGPADRLALDLNVRSDAGNIRGQVTADVQNPEFGVKGALDVNRLNLAPILKDPAQRTDLNAHVKADVMMASGSESAPITDRLHGSFAVTSPRVAAAGYEASDVRLAGRIDGSVLNVDGRAAAYGATATASGIVVLPAPKRVLALDVRGRADGLDLRKMPSALKLPKVGTDVSADYHIKASGDSIGGSATFRESTVEGAIITEGTTAEFASENGRVSYAARGNISNLNLERIGQALDIAALAKDDYESEISGRFDVKGSGTKVDEMRVDASGVVENSTVFGANIPQLGFEAHLDRGAVNAHADGRFEGVDPARVAGQEKLEGSLTGAADVTAQIADITAPLTRDAITVDAKVTLTSSTIAGLQIDEAEIDGRYASAVGDFRRVHLAGPDVKLDASGRVALDYASDSSLKYHVESTNVAALASLAGQSDVNGSLVLDGTVKGNASSFQTEGKLNGSGLQYGDNGALDLNSQYTVTVPELQFVNAKAQATTTTTFVKVGSLEINDLAATTTYADKRLEFDTKLKEKTRELEAKGDVVFHPDHQEIHLPQLALRTQGIEWRTAGNQAAVRYGGGKVELQDVKLASGDQTVDANGSFAVSGDEPAGALDVKATNVDLAQIEQLTLQNRRLTGRLTAAAKISGTSSQPIVSAHAEIANGGFQAYRYESLKADVDYQGTRIGVDTTLQQSATESITAKGTVPTSLFHRSEAGHVAPTAGDEVDLRIKSTPLGLGIVQGFTNQITNVAGTIEADVHVLGSGEDPHVEGFVDIKGGAFGVPFTGVSYSGLNTRVELRPDAVQIQQFQILDEEGHKMNVSGELAVHEREVGGVNINIDSQNFEVVDNELGDVGIDSQLKITGELRRPRVEGDIRLEAARLEVDKILALVSNPYSVQAMPDVVSAERTAEQAGGAQDATRQALSRAAISAAPRAATPEAGRTPGGTEQPAESAEAPSSGFAPVALNLRLRIPENLVLRGKNLRPGGASGASLGDMNITVGGDLHLRKDPDAQMTLDGSVDTVRGTYQFQGRRFDLARGGTMRFTGETEINPLLDITATRDIPNSGVQAQIHITGTMKAPELKLSSTPPLDESDVLALILFNRPVNELGTGERSSLATTAGGIATGFLAAPLGESIGKALDLDLFEITTTTETGELGPGVTIGQQVGDRAFFKMRQQFGDRNASEFLLDFQLAKFLRMEASAAPETSGSANRIGQRRIERAGLDLIFFFSY